jgi:FkbM family methyltransferase
MKYDYIEIGTSDFETIVQHSDGRGLSIEPFKFYLDNLPDRETNQKVCAAISDKIGEVEIYYVHPDDIHHYGLPLWVKGCNSILKKHPSVVSILAGMDLLHIYRKEKVDCLTWDYIIKNYNVTSLDYLKMDTEGYDLNILGFILDSSTNLLPKRILFECNMLTDKEEAEKVLVRLKKRGYEIVHRDGENIEVVLKNIMPDKIIFSSDDSDYLNFWKINSEICSRVLNITPVLLHITDEDSDFFWDEFGIVKKIKNNSLESHIAARLIRLYTGVLFPEDYILISDIDMLLFNRKFLKKSLADHEKYDVVLIGSDAYNKDRKESGEWTGGMERFPMCYIFCKDKILNRIMRLDGEEIPNDFFWKGNFNSFFNYHSDEIVFSQKLLSTNLKIHRVPRGYKSHFYISDRIEKYMFSEEHRENVGGLDLKELMDLENFVDCHCADYSTHEGQIKHIRNLILAEYA